MQITGTANHKTLAFLEHLSGLNNHKTVMVFKTNIDDSYKLGLIASALNEHSCINRWSVDMEDIDNVLRIETTDLLKKPDVISLISSFELMCEEL